MAVAVLNRLWFLRKVYTTRAPFLTDSERNVERRAKISQKTTEQFSIAYGMWPVNMENCGQRDMA